jgi:hypothetical protein
LPATFRSVNGSQNVLAWILAALMQRCDDRGGIERRDIRSGLTRVGELV